MSAITVNKACKQFGKLAVIREITLEVNAGEIFGLLGPNASGKTTLIRLLCGILPLSAGEVQLNGQTISQAKRQFGYVAQHFGLYEELTVLENIHFYAQLYSINDDTRIQTLLSRYGLQPFIKRRAGKLSGGYQRRLALACALVHDPAIVFLDEPTAGIDPITRKLLWDDFYQLSAEGKTLFVTTHYMEEAQRCHRLAFIAAGQITAEGTPAGILAALGEACVYATEIPYQPDLHKALLSQSGILDINQFGDQLRIIAGPEMAEQNIRNIISSVEKVDIELVAVKPNLEDLFLFLNRQQGQQQEEPV